MIRTPIRRFAGLVSALVTLAAGPTPAQEPPSASGFEMTDDPAMIPQAPPAPPAPQPTTAPPPPSEILRPGPAPQASGIKPEPAPVPAPALVVEPAPPISAPPPVDPAASAHEAPPPLFDPQITTEALEAMTALPGAPSTFEGTVLNRLDNAEDHSALAGAIRAASVGEKFVGPGPITVFAPTNSAFRGLPPRVIELMLKPENAARLAAVLDFHRVVGRLTADDLAAMADQGGGLATLTTLQGGVITVVKQDGRLILRDVKGGEALIGGPAIEATNGLILPVDTVLMP